ncbi:MAG: S8 family serine peptidase, partial [candidate division Zixibacteria bacterium]|nr:S8 family serine peptidase [candidate division Zixibacteria bacterium]
MGRKSRVLFRLAGTFSLFLATSAYPAVDIGPDIWNSLDRAGEVGIVITLKDFDSAVPMPKSALSSLSASQDNLISALQTEGFELGYKNSHLPIISGRANETTLLALYERDDVLAVEYDMPMKASLAQSVPLVQGDYVRTTLGYTGSGVVVAIVDTGMDTDHPNFTGGRILVQYHFLNAGGDVGPGAEDDNGHGTNCAGVAGSSGAVGSFGMAPQCDFVALKVLKSDGSGWLSDWTAALNWIIANNATLNISVISASLGSTALYTSECSASQTAMSTAVTTLRSMGVLLVAASGNDGDYNRMSAPACIGAAVSVGASFDSNLGREPNSGTWLDVFGGSWPPCYDDPANAKQITCFSNRNFLLDFLAPGRPITSSYIGGGLATFTGTSQATPHVSGLAALLLE